MTGIFSTVSGSFSKSLIFGFLLPAALFVFCFEWLVTPLVPGHLRFPPNVVNLFSEWQLLKNTLSVVIVSGVLYTLNNQIARLYQGYIGRSSWICRWREKHYKNKFAALSSRHAGMRTLLRKIDEIDKADNSAEKIGVLKELALLTGNKRILKHWSLQKSLDKDIDNIPKPELERIWDEVESEIRKKWHDIGRKLRTEFPWKKSAILPTRLGNVIRSFERYPESEYGMESIYFYPRLLSVASENYLNQVNESKTIFDFFLNISFLAFTLMCLLIIFGLTTTATLTVTFSGNADFIKWGISILLAGALSVQFYSLSVLQAEEWGTYIKAMFDLYRNDLLVKLGISQKPYSKKAERELWKAISAQFVYGDHLGTPRFDYHQYFPAERPYLPEKDLQKQLSVSRYFKLLKENLYEIYLVIEAAPLDPSASPKTLAENFWIVDVLPENWLFSYSSANFVKNQPNLAFYHAYTPIETEISGRECKFKIPAISPGENLRISYQAFVLKK